MTIDDLMEIAKATIFKYHGHPPIFYVQHQDGTLYIDVLEHLEETTLEKEIQCFTLGREIAQERKWDIAAISTIGYGCEAWASFYPVGTSVEAMGAPSSDPRRTEVLTVSLLETKAAITTCVNLEILRDGGGDFVDLLLLHPPVVGENSLLMTFVAGIISRPYSDQELAAMAKEEVNLGQLE